MLYKDKSDIDVKIQWLVSTCAGVGSIRQAREQHTLGYVLGHGQDNKEIATKLGQAALFDHV